MNRESETRHIHVAGEAPFSDPCFAIHDSVTYDESDPAKCPVCRTVMHWSSGKKKFCKTCGYVDSCCN